ncbi:hypothetical protein H7F10_14485 [Acidithiobacillus sp. HP-6]|uniref:hypothetical protein n=1 Tax=unclassified Acidithiobacillus TaxID=2614800 RepID=UPI00187A29F9|nr:MULTISPECIES: hypothetical protein [unclassified Acidithiobacillus]MBE7564109.1 hypothetical protein [Acidithiobacillus sp. HP-6]MBE7570810.1 hypothetical protein [Acidithiobacillus sp. HP-2]
MDTNSVIAVDISRNRRHGPVPLDPALKRVHSVNVRLNDSELAELNAARGPYQRAAWLRMLGIGKLPLTIPAINREVWTALSTVISNLNQYQAAINANLLHYTKSDPIPLHFLEDLLDQVQALRRELIGVCEDSDDGSEDIDDEGHA